MYGTEWPILCWCAVKKLLTHSLTIDYIGWIQKQHLHIYWRDSKTRVRTHREWLLYNRSELLTKFDWSFAPDCWLSKPDGNRWLLHGFIAQHKAWSSHRNDVADALAADYAPTKAATLQTKALHRRHPTVTHSHSGANEASHHRRPSLSRPYIVQNTRKSNLAT